MEFKFKVTSNAVHLTDPCYDLKTWCGAYNIPAKNGEWTVNAKYTPEGRVWQWEAYCEGYKKALMRDLLYEFGVDSGQFGIFDPSIYDENGDYGVPGFYNDCCVVTLNDDRCGVVQEQGFVSSSGFGDGVYAGKGAEDEHGNLVKFFVDFIDSPDDDDDEAEEED